MQIHQLRLINVKSYVDETLEFQPGINFISGINGAGKSTIIESLGYALFDYNPYVLRQFLREGASQGEIQVLIEGSDERLYRVIRKFTAGSSIKWEVWDEETSAMLDELHGSEDVKIWLKRAMGVAPGDDLSDLFRQVIAVQQGQFTTPFLEIPSSRTQIFDAVLKVEDYRKAFTQTSFLERAFQQEAESLQRQREILESTLVNLPKLEEELEMVLSQRGEKSVAIHKLELELEANLAQLEREEKYKARLEKLEKDLTFFQLKIENQEQQLETTKQDWAEAKEAKEVIDRHRPGFELYEQIQKELKVVEDRLEQKRSLEGQLNRLELTFASTSTKLEADQRRWAADKEQVSQDLSTINQEKQAQELHLQHLKEVEKDLASWLPVATKWRPILEERENWLKTHRYLLDDARTQRQRLQDLQTTISQVAVSLETLPQLQEELARLEAEDRLDTLRQQELEKRGELEVLLQNEDYLTKGLCPIIHQACPSERVAHGLDEFFKEQKEKLELDLQDLKTEIAQAVQYQEERTSLRDQVRDVQNQVVFMGQQQENYDGIFEATLGALSRLPWVTLEEINRRFYALGEDYKLQEELLTTKLTQWGLVGTVDLPKPPPLLDPVPGLPKKEDLNEFGFWLNALASWEGQLNTIHDNWRSYGQAWLGEISQLQAQLAAQVAVAKGEIERTERKLAELHLKQDQLNKEQISFKEQQRQLDEITATIANLSHKIAILGEPEVEQRQLKEQLEEHETSYQLYQANLLGAEKLSSLQVRLRTLEEELKNWQGQLTKTKEDLTQLRTEYSRETHQALDIKVQEQKTAQLELRRDLLELDRQEKDLGSRLRELRTREQEWRQKGEELVEAQTSEKFARLFRQVLKEAADPIAQQYRNSLSRLATQIYRQVSNENVRLEWGSQYELQLVDFDQGKERIRVFRQLSGGEQMTAALAIRLALMQLLSPISIGFFDEPTTNLDQERRESLALAIQIATGDFDQLFLISHDDSFDAVTENVISLRKEADTGSHVE